MKLELILFKATNLVSIIKPTRKTSTLAKQLAKHLTSKRKWKTLDSSSVTAASLLKSICSPCLVERDFKFKLSCYNILAPTYAKDHKYLYQNVSEKYLDWNYRRNKIINEIETNKHDIYCFQEMEESQYNEYFNKKFKDLGYYCLFKKRRGDRVDGLAVIFKKKKFHLESYEFIEYYMPNVDLLNKDNVAMMVLLRPKYGATNQKLCVATTHLLFSPKRGDIKLAQLQMLFANIDRFAFKECRPNDNGTKMDTLHYPTILCGDMNSTYNSNIYKFLVNSKLDDYHTLNKSILSGQITRDKPSAYNLRAPLLPEYVEISDQCQFKSDIDERKTRFNCDLKCTFGETCLTHIFNFKSVYNHINNEDGSHVVECTTCLPLNHETVDYIFYTSNSTLKLLSRLELFNQHHLENAFLPDKHYPSDHFVLSAKFLLKNDLA
jgi:protein angel